MHCRQWIFDMDGTLTDSMGVVWEGAPDAGDYDPIDARADEYTQHHLGDITA